jgi:glycosyltransferase involved in cell wall biosynthesis
MAIPDSERVSTVRVPDGPVRVLRVIARMNVGGPAHHVSLLSGRAFPGRFQTLLATGRVGPGEGSFDHLAAEQGATLTMVPGLGPEINPTGDLQALRSLIGTMRRFRPHIVHTHTAKAGLVGRTAALALRPRPIILHTYHGHVLEGYFSRTVSGAFTQMERGLARVSDRLIGVSQATVDDLVRLGVAGPDKFEVIPLGLRLERFLERDPEPVGPFRDELGLADGQVLATFTGRFVPIKRLDVLLEAFAHARTQAPQLVLAVVGDGPGRGALEAQAQRLGIADGVRFTGYRHDLPELLGASDMAVLSSDNEGTPVSLIEAAAAARPCVSTRAGGVADVVPPGAGLLVDRGDARGLGDALAQLSGDAGLRRRMGAAAREHAAARFTPERLVENVSGLYDRLLAQT